MRDEKKKIGSESSLNLQPETSSLQPSPLVTRNSQLLTPPRILGLDPGLHATGYGVIEATAGSPKLVEAGVLRIPDGGTLSERLALLFESVCEILDELKPTIVAVEELFSHFARPRTAVIMGHARGVLLLAAAQRGIPTASYLPTKVKRSLTGHGRASKEQMQAAIQMHFSLDKPPEPPDVADALAVALCHFHQWKTLP